MPIFCGSDQWMAAALSADGLIQSISNSAEQLTGYAPDELIARPLSCIVNEAGRNSVADMLQAARDWGVWSGEILHRVRSGRELEAQATVTPLTGRSDASPAFLLISTPIAESAALPSGVPTAAISKRLREIAHSLNNPLAIIMGFTQLILLDDRCDLKTRTDLERIYLELGRVIRTVESFHSYAFSLSQPQQDLETTRQ